MNLVESLRIALRALNSNKARAALTMLGVIIGVAAVALYAFVMTVVILKVISIFTPLRLSNSYEEIGLDSAVHGEKQYN